MLSADGYDKLLRELHENYPDINERLRTEFELQPPEVMRGE